MHNDDAVRNIAYTNKFTASVLLHIQVYTMTSSSLGYDQEATENQ